MRTVRLPLLRGALFIIALAAIAFILARGDNPAQATTYNPSLSISVSDPNPGAAADLIMNFSLSYPDAFVTDTPPPVQFLPPNWGVNAYGASAAPVGAMSGTFNALSNIAILGNPCFSPTPVPFTMYQASTDTSRTTSALDVGGDYHPMGWGYSGQFVDDPDTIQPPGDFGRLLVPFKADEKRSSGWGTFDGSWWGANAYRDVDSSGKISPEDVRLFVSQSWRNQWPSLDAGTVVQAGDPDIQPWYPLYPFKSDELHTDEVAANGQMDPGEIIYQDRDASGDVSYGDMRLVPWGSSVERSEVKAQALPGGVTRYPDFLNKMLPPDVIGDPLARQFAQKSVLGTPVSLNIVTYRPGQLPGYPASLGYPNLVVILDPADPYDVAMMALTYELCSPLSLTATNFGVSRDNPLTQQDEDGYVRLTNPKPEKGYDFTLIVTSQPDADDDGIENMLDTCVFTPNIENLDERSGSYQWGPYNPDGDTIDGACDPYPIDQGAINTFDFVPDEDLDNYGNRADNCPLAPNGIEAVDVTWIYLREMRFPLATVGSVIGPDMQADTDKDDIGDACEGSEHDVQCADDDDDDGDDAVNDGCPPMGATFAETGPQCDNALDDDADGKVNDGCPRFQKGGVAESGEQCSNDTDDDADGLINDGCPAVGTRAESAGQTRVFLRPDNVIASSTGWGTPQKAFDGLTNTDWCSTYADKAPGSYLEAQFVSPQTINSLDLLNRWRWEAFTTGRITMSNGFSQDITLTNGGGSFTFPPTQTGVTWVRFTGLTQNGGDACFTEFNLNLSIVSECKNADDDDGDDVVNDGCPKDPVIGQGSEWGFNCNDAVDNDGDGKVNDGCPPVVTPGAPETGDQCLNNIDDDGDGYVNDGCPAVDPGDVAKTATTGHTHTVTYTRTVIIARHGVKLGDIDGKEKVRSGGTTQYTVSVENKDSDDAQDAVVGLGVLGGCGTVNGEPGMASTTVSIPADGARQVKFTADWSGCPDGEYSVQADACHPGDAAPAGLFGAGACPGADPHTQLVPGQATPSGATASSPSLDGYPPSNAIDGNSVTQWRADRLLFFDSGATFELTFAGPVALDRIKIFHDVQWACAITNGSIQFSNGYTTALNVHEVTGTGEMNFPLQEGITWVRVVGTSYSIGCYPGDGLPIGMNEISLYGLVPGTIPDTNPLDDAPWSITVVVGP